MRETFKITLINKAVGKASSVRTYNKGNIILLYQLILSSGGAVVKNPPANAGDNGLIPGPGRFPHAPEQLSP